MKSHNPRGGGRSPEDEPIKGTAQGKSNLYLFVPASGLRPTGIAPASWAKSRAGPRPPDFGPSLASRLECPPDRSPPAPTCEPCGDPAYGFSLSCCLLTEAPDRHAGAWDRQFSSRRRYSSRRPGDWLIDSSNFGVRMLEYKYQIPKPHLIFHHSY